MSNVEDEALSEWRRKAANIVISASALLHSPLIVLVLLGFGPPLTWFFKAALIAGYAVTAAGALLRRIDYRIRVSAMLCAIYIVAATGIAATPQGPYMRALPLVVPMLAIGLIGVRVARIAMPVSAGVVMFAPLLRAIPAVACCATCKNAEIWTGLTRRTGWIGGPEPWTGDFASGSAGPSLRLFKRPLGSCGDLDGSGRHGIKQQ